MLKMSRNLYGSRERYDLFKKGFKNVQKNVRSAVQTIPRKTVKETAGKDTNAWIVRDNSGTGREQKGSRKRCGMNTFKTVKLLSRYHGNTNIVKTG